MKISNLLYTGALSTLALMSCTTTTTTVTGTEAKASFSPQLFSLEFQIMSGMQTMK